MSKHLTLNGFKTFSTFRSFHTSVALRKKPVFSEDDQLPKWKPGLFPDAAENVLKIHQRFKRELKALPREEQPFAIIDRKFVGKVISANEMCPERGFAYNVNLGLMVLRVKYRHLQAVGHYFAFKDTGIYDVLDNEPGYLKAFELVTQNAYKDNLDDLVKREVCFQFTVDRFAAAAPNMSSRQRELLNLTEDDVFTLAPGAFGPYHMIRPKLFNKIPYLTKSIMVCAFYKRKLLFDAVQDLPLLSNATDADILPIPEGYGFSCPRFVMGYLTFGNRCLAGKELDPEVKLLDFQFIVM